MRICFTLSHLCNTVKRMTPTEGAARLTREIIDKHIKRSGETDPRCFADALATEAVIVPRRELPPVKYDGATCSYEHRLGYCHEDAGADEVRSIAYELLAIAEHMDSRLDMTDEEWQLDLHAFALFSAQSERIGLRRPAAEWPNDQVRREWMAVARQARDLFAPAPHSIEYADPTLTGMDR